MAYYGSEKQSSCSTNANNTSDNRINEYRQVVYSIIFQENFPQQVENLENTCSDD